MARSTRNSNLENRTARLLLPVGKMHYVAIGKGLILTYRRGERTSTWYFKIPDGDGYLVAKLGQADDYQDANGVDILDYFQAQDKARQLSLDNKVASGIVRRPLTVADAAEHYLAWYKEHRKAYKATETTVKAHILPTFGKVLVADLTTKSIQSWHEKIASSPPRRRTRMGIKQKFADEPVTDSSKRARKNSANRVPTVLKAMLNMAFRDDLVSDDKVWRKVQPFQNVEEPLTRFLTGSEATRLLNACRPDFRNLVKAGLFTGARFGELTRMIANNVNADTALVYISAEAKSSKGRYVPLHADALDFFEQMVIGKRGNELVFTKQDGKEWGKNHHARLLKEACEVAKIEPAIGFHELRHTYASHLAQLGVDLLTISKLLGHADTRITSKHYAHLADSTLAEAVKKLPSFGHNKDSKVVRLP
ncbi:MAG: tyrosine-type recombinase/integrase [Gallionella sp.]